MGRRFVPINILLAILAFVIGAVTMAFVPDLPRLWPAAVGLIVLGGITPMIYAVNVRVVPVFGRRPWTSQRLLFGAIGTGIAGAWLVFLGRALSIDALDIAGSALALAGGLGFFGSLVRLFRQPASAQGALPQANADQVEADQIGQYFTRMASIYLLIGLVVGLMTTIWTPDRGRWDLVWAHTMLLGWFLSMAAGVCYHVLPRWSGRARLRPGLMRLHLALVLVGLPVMLIALALDLSQLFFVAGPVLTITMLLFVGNIVSQVRQLPSLSRYGVGAAMSFLSLGVLLGAGFALDPGNHAGLRFTHAQLNLYGWGALLVCGMGYYLFPRFAGQPLRWPRLAVVQISLVLVGVVISAVGWWVYFQVDSGMARLVTLGELLIAAGLILFCAIIGSTFRQTAKGPGAVGTISVGTRRPLPMR